MPIVSKSGSLNLLETSKPVTGLHKDCFTFADMKANAARRKLGLSEEGGCLFITTYVSSSYILRMLSSSGRFRDTLIFFNMPKHLNIFNVFWF